MKLLPGNESAERVALPIEFIRIESKPLIEAVNKHLVDGFILARAARMTGVAQQRLGVTIKTLNKHNTTHEKLKQLDYRHTK